MKRGKTKGKKGEPKPYTGLEALLVFPDHGDYVATLDLMRRFSAATRYGYHRLLEGQDREELKREDGPLCTLFRLDTRYADDALLKAKALLTSVEELGGNPRKVVFGGRKLFADLIRTPLESIRQDGVRQLAIQYLPLAARGMLREGCKRSSYDPPQKGEPAPLRAPQTGVEGKAQGHPLRPWG